MSTTPAGSPKGNIRLHPGDNTGEVDYNTSRPRLNEELENMNNGRRLRALALRLAYNVIKTPQEFISGDRSAEEQEWSVMPDETSSEPGYKPISKHRNRAEAVRAMKNLENKETREEESARRRHPEPRPTQELPPEQQELENKMTTSPEEQPDQTQQEETTGEQTAESTEAIPEPVEQPETPERPEPEGETAEEKAVDEPDKKESSPVPKKMSQAERQQPTVKASATRRASVERRWMDIDKAANQAWERRQKKGQA